MPNLFGITRFVDYCVFCLGMLLWNKINIVILLISIALMFYFLLSTRTRSPIVCSFVALLVLYPIPFKLSFKSEVKFVSFLLIVLFGFFFTIKHFVEGDLSERIVNVDPDVFFENFRNGVWRTVVDYGSTFVLGAGSNNEYIAFNQGAIKKVYNVDLFSFVQTFKKSFIQTRISGFPLIVFGIFFIINKRLEFNNIQKENV